ncbi:MAG: hypothetical protein ACOYNB_12065 [Aquabacterium sp.]|uniref:hypothetical protein n=1 Tax=Aquabacterium sp. TaxID=1872578 RepID=UPI003BDFBB9E
MTALIVLAMGLAVSSLVLFVLPGYYLFLVGDWLFGTQLGHIHGDNLLPIAMQVQMLWAPALPLSYAFARRFYLQRPGRTRMVFAVAMGMLTLYAWAAALAVVFHALMAEVPA